jgi:CheY-like chemotaxis protein
MMATGVPVEVVLVEDNPGDVRLVREGLKGWTLQTRLRVVRDGEQALSLFRGEGSYAGTPRPDVVILDLNLPRKDGRELLAEMQADPALRKVPVVVLTSSIPDQEVLRRGGLKIDLYIVKPVRLDDFLAAVRSIEEFWRRAAGA